MNGSNRPLELAAGSGAQDFNYVPILPDNAVRTWKIRNVNRLNVDMASGTRKALWPCEGWTRHVHPCGRVYLRHDDLRVVMEGNEYLVWNSLNGEPTPFARWSRLAAQHLWGLVPDAERGDYELFLCIQPPSIVKVSYYFVDWAKRSVFWVHTMETPQPIASLTHLAGVRELQFWAHVDYYPMHHELPHEAREELDATLAYHTIDAMAFKETTAPWKSEETHLLAKSLSEVPHSFSGRPSHRSSMGSDITTMHASSAPAITVYEGTSNASVARLWRQIWLCRVHDFYGDSYARLSRTERRNLNADAQEPPEWLRTILSLLLFNRPPRFYNELRNAFVDDTIYQAYWKTFLADDANPEWRQDGIMMATVMLAANMAFLALSGVDDAAEGPLLASKVLSLSSTIFSTATLFAAMRLIAFHAKLKSATATNAIHYMRQCSTKPLGLFGVAMLFSIPFVTFMWSILTYLAAMLLFSFQHWSMDTGVPLVTTTVVPVLVVLGWMWWFFATSPLKGDEEHNE